MRSWILMGALLLAEAIRPDHEYAFVLAIPLIVLGIVGFAMDIVEFKEF